MYVVDVRGGAYAMPRGICVACGQGAASDHVIKAGNSDLRGKTFLNMAFPLCDECAAVRERRYERPHDADELAVIDRVAEKHYERPHDAAERAVIDRVQEVKAANESGVVGALLHILRDKVHADPEDLKRLAAIKAEDQTWKKARIKEDRERLEAIKAEDQTWKKARVQENREREKAVNGCVKITGVSRDGATFKFSNPVYGHAFALANLGRATERAV
jgi:hypothetical protein